jgi:quercetin dioxygenase-like cupin family protein
VKQRIGLMLLLCATAAAQKPAPIPDAEVPQRKEIFRNDHVTASLVELAPQEGTPTHQHDRDLVTVFVTAGNIEHSISGARPTHERIVAGTVRFHSAGFTHAVQNVAATPFRAVSVEFAQPQGNMERVGSKNSHYCNPGSKSACVDEKYLFCTAKVCVEDVSIAPGAVTIKHSHTTDHMLIAVSDYELTDKAEGKGTTVRTRKSGELEYIPAGITHQLTNTGKNTARFAVIVWR